jgi:hypothetical protein
VIDIEDLLLFAGMVILLVVAFHFGLWTGIALLGIVFIAGSVMLGKIKAANPNGKGKK